MTHLSPLFEDNQVTMRDLRKLQPSDLQDIGIKKLMDRKRILEAANDNQPVGSQIDRDTNIEKSVTQTLKEVIFIVERNKVDHCQAQITISLPCWFFH